VLYEIINPSDAYTLEGDDFEAACFAVLVLGQGQYALEPQERDAPGMGLFVFGGAEDWWLKQFGYPLQEASDRIGRERLAAALESVLIGSADNRRTFKAAEAFITDPVKRREYMEQYHDRKRSSLNDIGGRAMKMAAALRRKIAAGEK
jgi:hypothetical protein